MAKGFWRGIIAGGLVGGLIDKFMKRPQRKILDDKKLKKQMNHMGVQAKKAVEGVREGFKDLYKK
ncbi:MAG: hypothetical protein WDA53_00360 [Bacillota bacterium]